MHKTVDIVMSYTDNPGGRYTKLAKALCNSVKRNFPKANMVVDTGYPVDGLPHNAMAYRWCNLAQQATRPTVFVGCDTLVLRDFSEVFQHDFGLAVTTRDAAIPLNNGVVFMQPTTEGKGFMAEYADIMTEMMTNTELHRRYDKHGPVDQAAMEHLWRRHPGRIMALPCSVYNITQDYYHNPLPPDAAVVHIKSELRDCIFGIDSKRVKRTGITRDHELVQLWERYHGGPAV